MPIFQDKLMRTCMRLTHPLSDGDLDTLRTSLEIKFITADSGDRAKLLQCLNTHVLPVRPDLELIVETVLSESCNLGCLKHIPQLKRLCVASSFKEISASIECIAELQQLESLQIGSPGLKSLDALNLLNEKTLRTLRVAPTDSTTLSLKPIARFSQLEKLSIECHQNDLQSVGDLKSLRYLSFSYVNLDDLGLLTLLPNLRAFILHNSNINDYSVLSSLCMLKFLDIFHSKKFLDLDFLKGLKSLVSFYVGLLPELTQFPDLSELNYLKKVSIYQLKRLRNLDGLAMAPNLESFLHTGALSLPTDAYSSLLVSNSVKYFTAIYGSKKKDLQISDLAKQYCKLPYDPKCGDLIL